MLIFRVFVLSCISIAFAEQETKQAPQPMHFSLSNSGSPRSPGGTWLGGPLGYFIVALLKSAFNASLIAVIFTKLIPPEF